MAHYRFTFDAHAPLGWDVEMLEDWLHAKMAATAGESPVVPGSVKAEVLSEDD